MTICIKAIGFLIVATGVLRWAPAEEILPPSVPEKSVGPQLAWIGLDVGKLEKAMRAHAADVPDGVGFLVTAVSAGGPAEEAGIKGFDILWKFEDQLLVNEAQFGALLRLRRPGDKVSLQIVRGGEQRSIDVELGTLPLHQTKPQIAASEIPLYPTGMPGMPRQIIYPQDRTAEISREDGSTAKLRYEGQVAMIQLLNPDGEIIFDGPLRKDGVTQIPEDWRLSVGALVRTMWKAETDEWRPREPRPRVVAPPPVRSTGE